MPGFLFCREEFFCKKFEYQNHLSNETHPRTLSIAAHASNDNALSLLKTWLTKINKFPSWRDLKSVEFINHHGKTEGSESERERQI